MIIQRFKDFKIERLNCNLLIVITLCSLFPVVSSAQMTWTCACSSAQWSARSGHTSVVFDNKIWVIGGAVDWSLSKEENDVWYSTDGINWTCATESAPWSARCCHTSVVFDGKMWVIGGMHWAGTNSIFFNDVWCSTGGANWTRAASSAPWSGRANHQSVVFNDRMWVIAGVTDYSPYTLPREVWCSTDGDSWVCVTDTAPWEGREGPALEVYHDTMWLMGGVSNTRNLNDVWYSTDGANWRKTSSAPWSVRFAHKAAVFQDKLWITGGLNQSSNMNDAWHTSDGTSWICEDSSAEWRPRASHTLLVYDNKLWVMGGDSTWNFLTTNDVWYSYGPPGIEEFSTSYLQSLIPNATIVRGVLYLPSVSSIKRQALSVLLDITGCKVADLKAGANNIRHLAPGVYFIRRNNNNQVTKIVVTR